MQKRSFAIIFALAIFAALSSLPAYAQNSESIGVNVPFAFTTKSETLPAGYYRIQPRSDNRIVWVLNGTGPQKSEFLMAMTRTGSSDGKVVVTFHRYGGRNFLVGFKTPGYDIILPTSKDEKSLVQSGMPLSEMKVIEVEVDKQGPSSGR